VNQKTGNHTVNGRERDPREGYWHGSATSRGQERFRGLPLKELLDYAAAVKAHERVRQPSKAEAQDGRWQVGQEQETVALKALRAAVLKMP